MTPPMVERVARAIQYMPCEFIVRRAIDRSCFEVVRNDDPECNADETMHVISTHAKERAAQAARDEAKAQYQARVAIEAMREPTQPMIVRVTDQMEGIVSPNHAAIAWQLLIDAAINEGRADK